MRPAAEAQPCAAGGSSASPPRPHVLPAGAEGGPLLDVIEGCLSRLLEESLEDSTFQALQANLQGGSDGSGSTPGAAGGSTAGALAPVAVAPQSLALAAFAGGRGGGGAQHGAAAAAAALAEGRAQAAALERCSLLNILTLIYYHPRQQCTPDRFLSLAKLFHSHLFTRALTRPGGAANGGEGGEPSPAQLSIKLVSGGGGAWPAWPVVQLFFVRGDAQLAGGSRQPLKAALLSMFGCTLQATLLLLEMLDVDKALAVLAAEQPIDEAVRTWRGLSVCA